jgi:hypothetical protein
MISHRPLAFGKPQAGAEVPFQVAETRDRCGDQEEAQAAI